MTLDQRTSADISIMRTSGTLYNPTVTPIVTVPITEASRRTYRLMEEDSITLVWSGTNIYRFIPGDYIDDELFGRFVVTQEQTGQWNKSKGGYDYQLRLVSQYWAWNNHVLMYTGDVQSDGGSTPIFDGDPIINPRHAPGTVGGSTIRHEARYHLTGMLIDHLNVVLENVKLLGVISGATYTLAISAERKDEIHYICYDGMHICDALTAIANEYETEWWVTETGNSVVIHMGKCELGGNPVVINPGVEIESYAVSRNQNTFANRIIALGSDKNIPRSYGKQSSGLSTISCKVTERIFVESEGGEPIEIEGGVGDNEEELDIHVNPGINVCKFRDANHIFTSNMCKIGMVEVKISGKTQVVNVDSEGYLFFPAVSQSVLAWEDIAVGNIFTVNIYDPESTAALSCGLYEIKIPESWYAGAADDPSSLISFGERRLMLPSEEPDGWDDNYVIDSYGRWVQKSGTREQNIVEQVVIFENIYPKCYLQVTSVREEPASQKEVFSDGSFKMWNWTRYTIEAVQYPSGDTFIFDAGFTDGKLEAIFLSDMDEQAAYYEMNPNGNYQPGNNSRLLAGMTFGVGFRTETVDNVKHYYYELARNEDYGALLPNDVMKPAVGDVFVLTGWDPKAMKMTGLIDTAEKTLAMAVLEYIKAIEEGQFTFYLGMMTDWVLGGSTSSYALPDPGRKYSLPLPIDNSRKVSRVIGYELKLDMPYDTPQLTVGETEAYSRLKQMERRMSGQVSSGYTALPSSDVRRMVFFRVYLQLSHVSTTDEVYNRVVVGGMIETRLLPDEGYSITSVTVYVGGEEVAGAYDEETGELAIYDIFGDVVIEAEAETITESE